MMTVTSVDVETVVVGGFSLFKCVLPHFFKCADKIAELGAHSGSYKVDGEH